MTGGNSHGWPLWRRQITVLAKQEIGRSLFSTRSLAVYLLAGMPIALAMLRAIFMSENERAHATHTATEFAQVFHFFLLRFIVFFSAALLFVKLFRGEILERSLHYHLLAPVRREVLVIGKYLGGFVASATILGATVALTIVLFYLPNGSGGMAYLTSAAGLGDVFAYVVTTVLACAAYGALFMLAGLFFKNPMVPAVLFLGWEVLTPFLPGFLKVLSIVHYLGSLEPVPISQGPFALMAQPVPEWLAVIALIVISGGLLALSAWKARGLEVTYSTE